MTLGVLNLREEDFAISHKLTSLLKELSSKDFHYSDNFEIRIFYFETYSKKYTQFSLNDLVFLDETYIRDLASELTLLGKKP